MSSEKLWLKWSDFQSNVTASIQELREDTEFCDVTLVSEGNMKIKAHKTILASSSPIFMEILKNNKPHHPLINFYEGGQTSHLASVVDFIYNGEVNIFQKDLDIFLVLAEELQIKWVGSEEEEDKPKTKLK